MTERWLVVGADERMKVLARSVASEERTVFYKNKTSWDAELNATALEFHPDVIVLPIQPLKIDVQVVLGIQQALVHVGKLSPEWEVFLKKQTVHRYLQQEAFIWQNAALTAEAFLAYFYERKQAVRHKRFIITGFGRVAKMTAHMLKSMQADVVILVRSVTQHCEALALGYESYLLDELPHVEGIALINTIPAKWLTPAIREQLLMPIYDLASAPGCVTEEMEQYELLAGLPGKYFSTDAANLLKTAILDWRAEQCLKENALD
ncbi:dipicolinate synthase subunit A [Metasolibacillus meyeri]|uniref:Dipicolinate synthase subunit A n=1 Tax=Metasolibacillus meyeri TaxID=1071052 RepID=A0AAW9NKL1_9BACL|nr:dipicolinate synthase subunit A [Metasolibacillus meyeri]MEC1179299.1 dipicolinate synthase subunit A [Metasolibacillus meyeri]